LLLDPSTKPPRIQQRLSAVELIGEPVQSSLEFASDDLLLFKSQTALGAAQDNRLFVLDLASGEVQPLATAARDEVGAGYGIALGGMSCAPGCGSPCLVADASRGKLLRFELREGRLQELFSIELGGAGLPPKSVAAYW
jgi:hypothetical protein